MADFMMAFGAIMSLFFLGWGLSCIVAVLRSGGGAD